MTPALRRTPRASRTRAEPSGGSPARRTPPPRSRARPAGAVRCSLARLLHSMPFDREGDPRTPEAERWHVSADRDLDAGLPVDVGLVGRHCVDQLTPPPPADQLAGARLAVGRFAVHHGR